MIEWSRRVAALTQVRVADVDLPVISRDDDHHLRRVLRAEAGEEVVVTDGAGSWRFATLTSTGLEVTSEVVVDPAPTPTTLYLAPLVGERGEWAVAKAVEVGVTTLVPLVSARVQRFRGESREKTLSRWRRIAREAAGQCRRTYDLVIAAPVTPSEVAPEVAICDHGGGRDWTGVRAVCVGPEGGWAPGEWDEDRVRLSLGELVLRGETAAVLAGALLGYGASDQGVTLRGSRMHNDEST